MFVAVYCSERGAVCRRVFQCTCATSPLSKIILQHNASPCNTLQHTATHCNTLQHTATHCNILQHTATHCNALQHTATNCNTPAQRRRYQTSMCEQSQIVRSGICSAGCCRMLRCVVVCGSASSHGQFEVASVLQCVAVCCSVLRCDAVCCSVLQYFAVCCSVLQCVTVRAALQGVAV